MIEIEEGRTSRYVSIICPVCKARDAMYMNVPECCYLCGNKNLFDIEKIETNVDERINYHFSTLISRTD